MVDGVKRKRSLAVPSVKPGCFSPTVSFRVRGGTYAKLKASAEVNGFSLSEEMEQRIAGSFNAETLEATLRRVVREEIAMTMRAVLGAADADLTGLTRATVEVAMEDALAVMAEAQH